MNADKLIKMGIDLRNRWSGEVKTICPKCAHQRKKKNDPSLGVNIDTGVWKCHHCGWSGSVNQYVRPEPRKVIKSEGIFEYFEKRKISRETVEYFGITESVEWMPQDQKEHRTICFNYFLDSELINIKFKTKDKMFKMVKDARKIPYNIDSIKGSSSVIICEGEEEAMVWHQSGCPAVSVPNGASKNNNNLDWLDSTYELFENKTIYLATDNDEPGRKLQQDIARRFSSHDIRLIEFPEHEKDANDCLKRYGQEFVTRLFIDAKPLPVAEISNAEDFLDVIKSYQKDGYPIGAHVEMSETDQHISWNRGELGVVTGIPGCFDKNQLIHTKRGVVPICEITTRDYVLSYNESLDTNEWRRVIATPVHPTTKDRMFKITLKDGTVIKVTENHEFYNGNEYVKIKELLLSYYDWETKASILKLEDILSVEVIPCEEVYDLTVEENHNYYLATNTKPILVHNSGKSTWLDYMFIRLAYLKNWKFGVFSPENIAPLKITRMTEQLLGKPLAKMNSTEIERGVNIIDKHFWFYNVENLEDFTLTNLLRLAETMVRRQGIDCLLLDPFNYIENDGDDESSNEKIGNLLRRLKKFAVKNNVLVVLVAHPRKMDKTSAGYNVPRLYDISGSHHFFNVPDWGLAVHRSFQNGQKDPVEVHIQKIKWHFRGKLGRVDYEFDRESGQYSEDGIFKSLLNVKHDIQNDENDLFGSQEAWGRGLGIQPESTLF